MTAPAVGAMSGGKARARVGVLTFHRCINYGSYWQARCLVEGLARLGLDAVLLDHQSARVKRREWVNAFRPTLPTPSLAEDRPLYRRKLRLFLEAFDSTLPLTPPFPLEDPGAAGAFDAVVVGSDEVWNFRHPWYSGKPIFFGEGLKTERRIAYAASFGNHDAASGVGDEWVERLQRFSALSVRDENSRGLIAGALGRDPPVVLDPCLQFADVAARPTAPQTGEIVIYGHSFPDWLIAAVRAFAHQVQAPLVSFGYRNDWADVQRIDEGPEAFARTMGGAGAVVTNFFHGCVFATINGRPFVSALSDYRTNKVSDLLNRLGLASRLMRPDSSAADYAQALSRGPDTETERRLRELRAASGEFLNTALAGL